MESSTKDINYRVLEGMMTHDDVEPENRGITRGTVIILGTLGVFLIAAIIAVMVFVGNAGTAKREKHERMETIASSFSEGQPWEQVKSESPSDNAKGWLVKEWAVNSQSEVEAATAKLGITMSDVAYRAGCTEGSNGEFLIQVCSSLGDRNLSLVIGQ